MDTVLSEWMCIVDVRTARLSKLMPQTHGNGRGLLLIRIQMLKNGWLFAKTSMWRKYQSELPHPRWLMASWDYRDCLWRWGNLYFWAAAEASCYTAHQIPAFPYCVCHFFISYVLSQVKSKDVQVRGKGYLTRQYKSGSHACPSQPWTLPTLWILPTLAQLQSLCLLISCVAMCLGLLGRKPHD